jgi:hypothetical protein
MRTETNRSRVSKVVAVAMGILVMVATLGAPAFAASSPVTVVGTSVSGGDVRVVVRNSSLLPQTATVSVQAVVGDTAVWSSVPVVLLGGQTATVNAGFTANVSSVTKVGVTVSMNDDNVPY